MNTKSHTPVLLKQAVRALNVGQSKLVVDATYGRGGHTSAIVQQLSKDARLVVMDKDPQAIEHALHHWAGDSRVEIIHASFSRLQCELEQRGMFGHVDALLFDFGLSSPQLDDPSRGFSFSRSGPLDMRMNPDQGQPASAWLEQVEEDELVTVLKKYGEERYARRVARNIKTALRESEITSTIQLSQLVSKALPRHEKGKHPATRTFQAIRIAVNQELAEIEQVLPQALDALAPGGRLVMISFHSLEDRMVKRFFKQQSKGDPYPVDLPVTQDMLNPRLCIEGKAVSADSQEIRDNPRARSAVMRVARKLDEQSNRTVH